MPATMNVLYPADAKFNMEYYLSSHMPLVQKKWGSQGLKHWKVVKFAEGQQYCVQAILEWSSVGEFGAAAQSEGGKEVMADIPNFCDKQPTIVYGDVVGQQS